MRGIGLVVLCAAVVSAGCGYHWPFRSDSDLTPLGRRRDERRESRPVLETAASFVLSAAVTIAVHEGAHALAAELAGADDVQVSFLTEDSLGLTTWNGDLTDGQENFIDLAGPAAVYGLGEITEWMLARDHVPDSWRPWVASLSLMAKADFASQPLSAMASDSPDFAEVSRRAEFSRALWFIPLGADVLTHQDLYFDLLRESTTRPVHEDHGDIPHEAPEDDAPQEEDSPEPPQD